MLKFFSLCVNILAGSKALRPKHVVGRSRSTNVEETLFSGVSGDKSSPNPKGDKEKLF